jgi:DNA-binding MurR/RpiR family transcriptional regulator
MSFSILPHRAPGGAETFGAPSLPRIRQAIDEMPDALSRIGKYVLDNPEKVVRASLAELAVLAQSGEASVVRFCQHLGYAGFRDFKIALTAEVASRRAVPSRPEAGSGGIQPLANRLSTALDDTAQNIDVVSLTKLAKRLNRSRRIDVFGSGVSGFVAQMVAYRLMRVGLVAQAFQDATLVHEVMNGLDDSCVAIGVSETGLTADTLRFLTGARAAGAFALAITGRPNSPLAQVADEVLFAVPVNPPPIGGEMTAAPAKILLIEALAAAIAAH